MSEIAHLGPVELLTPDADASLHFFSEVLGMEIEARDGRSVYLRGWGDYQRYSLKLTESDTSGMAWLGIRAWSPQALERRVAAVRAAGLGRRVDGRRASAAAAPATASAAPTATCSSSTTTSSATAARAPAAVAEEPAAALHGPRARRSSASTT